MDLSRAALVIIGNEILAGKRTDTNSTFLGQNLASLGITVMRKVTVRDAMNEIVGEVGEALRQARLVITSGGLGPTIDDITRDALSEATGIGLHLDEEYLGEVKAMFERRGLQFVENNRSVAMVPDRGCFFRNPNGSAPGLCFEGDEFVLVALPGPPQELEPLFQQSVIPRLKSLDASLREGEERVFRLVGLGESNIDQEVRGMLRSGDPVDVSSIPHLGWVEVTFTLREPSSSDRQRLEEICSAFSTRFEKEIFGGREDTLESRVGDLLRQRGQTLATAESCTGGLIGGRLTATAGSSDYYVGGMVAYSDDVKRNSLRIDAGILRRYGAVSAETASAMALGVRVALGTEWGISCTGIAGPGGGSQQKPVGLVYLGISGPPGEKIERHQFLGSRDAIRERTVVAALNLLRRSLLAGSEG